MGQKITPDFTGQGQGKLAPTQEISLHVSDEGRPLKSCPVVGVLTGPGENESPVVVTDANGTVTFEFGLDQVLDAVLIYPTADYWSRWISKPLDQTRVSMIPLPTTGPTAWWHDCLGEGRFDPSRGQGIKIGVIDSGCAAHPHLRQIDSGSFFNAELFLDERKDVLGHGTHVCGLINSRPDPDYEGYRGFAPGSEVISIRVYDAQKSATQDNISDAIDYLSEVRNVHLINLSIGRHDGNPSLRDAVVDAAENGTLVFAAAGNSGKEVMYPAAYPEVVAVSAVGKVGWGAQDSYSRARGKEPRDVSGSFFVPAFSCNGSEICCCAPGVGIISTVPPKPESPSAYGVMDGTSMASPLACAFLAGLLASDDVYLSLSPNRERTEYARNVLLQSCRDLGLAPILQGKGLIGDVK